MGPQKQKKKVNAIRINDKWCKQCGICVEFCPREVLVIETRPIPTATDLANCTACRMCELHCPDYAISVEEINA